LAGRISQARRSLSRRPPVPLPFIESIGAICWANGDGSRRLEVDWSVYL
jgi:hypothetical protein